MLLVSFLNIENRGPKGIFGPFIYYVESVRPNVSLLLIPIKASIIRLFSLKNRVKLIERECVEEMNGLTESN